MLLGALLGWYIHHYYVTWAQRGREAFIAYQAHRFDQYMATPSPIAMNILSGIVVAVLCCGAYELIAWGVSALLKPLAPAGQAPTTPQLTPGGRT